MPSRVSDMALRTMLARDHTGVGNPAFSSVLDAARWMAALCVVTAHASSRILVPFQELGDAPLLAHAFYAVNGFGHTAVVVFFVLSGYLVGGKGVVAAAQGRFDTRSYLAARVARLHAVLLPALLLTWGADAASNALSGPPDFRRRRPTTIWMLGRPASTS